MDDAIADRASIHDRGVAARRPRRAGAPDREGRFGAGSEIDIMAIASAVWQRKFTVAAFGLVFGLLAIAAVYAVTPLYRTEAVVMLDSEEEQFIDLQSVVSGVSTDYFAILAEVEVLRSRKLAARVVDKLNLTENPMFNPDLVPESDASGPVAWIGAGVQLVKDLIRGAVTDAEPPGRELIEDEYFVRETAIDRLLGMQSVASVDSTYVYRITVETVDPVLSARIANAFAEAYITDQLEKKFEATQAATVWLSERVAELRTELEESEAAVESYNSGTTLISEEALAAMSRQLKELRERREETLTLRETAEARAGALRAALAADAPDPAGDYGAPGVGALAEDLAALRRGGADEAEIAAVVARFRTAAERALARAEVDAARAEDQARALAGSIAELETRLSDQTADLVQLGQLQREAEANRRIYEQFLRRLNETSVQEGVQQPDARLLSPAVIDFRPSYPRKTLTVLAAGLLGGVLGLIYVIVMEQLNRSFRSGEDLERTTGLPVLGLIPSAPVRRRRDLLNYARERGSSQLMEAVRNLRTGVLLGNVDSPPKVVLLTSSMPKEGKTTCSLLLAHNAAALGLRTLVIECDLRRRTFRNYFDIPKTAGLLNTLTDEAPLDRAVFRHEDTGLDVIPGQQTNVNAADVFSSRRFRAFLDQARAEYDFVVIDTPPVLAVPDARVIAPLVDAVLYCVRWNSTHKDLLRNGISSFEQIQVPVTGLVMTQIDLRKMARYGYGGYNYYYYKSSSRYYLN